MNIGRVMPVFRGRYDSNTKYEKSDVVYYKGSSYMAKKDNINTPPIILHGVDDSTWKLILESTDIFQIRDIDGLLTLVKPDKTYDQTDIEVVL